MLPFLYGAPSWAVAVDRHYGSPVTLPVKNGRQRAAWANFVAQAVLRYGPQGSFWKENPGVPFHPVWAWQIWNEENFEYFVARPNPADYGKLVKLSYSTIKALDPSARIILGGMFARPKEALYKVKPALAYFATDFIREMYRTTPGIKSRFNGFALHPYTREISLSRSGDRRSAGRHEGQSRRRQGALDHRAGLELSAWKPARTSSRRA